MFFLHLIGAWSDLPSIWASDNVPPLTRRIASSLLYGAFIIRPHLIHVAPWGDEQVAGYGVFILQLSSTESNDENILEALARACCGSLRKKI